MILPGIYRFHPNEPIIVIVSVDLELDTLNYTRRRNWAWNALCTPSYTEMQRWVNHSVNMWERVR